MKETEISTHLNSSIAEIFKKQFIKKIKVDTTLLQGFASSPLTLEQKHRRDIEGRWYERRLKRARRALERLGVKPEELCECDY